MKPKKPRPLFSFILRAERAVADRLVADEVDVVDADLRSLVDVEGEVDGLRAAGHFLDLGLDLRELVALLRVQLAHDAGDAADRARDR